MNFKKWHLIDQDGNVKQPGDWVTTLHGVQIPLDNPVGMPPQHSTSTGRIYLRQPGEAICQEYFPSVCNLKWVQDA